MNLQNELEISDERQERNEHGADWESKAESYLRSILDNDDQLINKNKSQKVRCLKVPPRLRNHKRSKDYYDPKVVSFGPYHHKKAELQAAQTIKTKVIQNFILEHGKTIKDLYIKVREQIDHTRSCYVDGSTNAYDDEEFALMMLQDGCFILFLIECWTDKKEWQTSRKDNILMILDHLGALEVKCLYRDLLLLENQIPFRVLNVLMSNIYKENEGLTMIKSYLYRIHWGKFQRKIHETRKRRNHIISLDF
jgi:hypothetical protein